MLDVSEARCLQSVYLESKLDMENSTTLDFLSMHYGESSISLIMLQTLEVMSPVQFRIEMHSLTKEYFALRKKIIKNGGLRK